MDYITMIIEYESGELSEKDTMRLFAMLIQSGKAWSLQGHYGRTAKTLIDQGLLTRTGEYTDKLNEILEKVV